jgi:hypothetical protein
LMARLSVGSAQISNVQVWVLRAFLLCFARISVWVRAYYLRPARISVSRRAFSPCDACILVRFRAKIPKFETRF